MTYRLGVDVGGTFTDLLLFDEASGAFWRHKTPSTPHDSSEGILTGVKAITEKAGITAADIAYFLHGTTVATNAVLEGKGAKVGLVTTQGYRDIMQIARSFVPGGSRPGSYGPSPSPSPGWNTLSRCQAAWMRKDARSPRSTKARCARR